MLIGIDARMVLNRQTGIGRYIINLVKELSEIDKKNSYKVFIKNNLLEEILGIRNNIKFIKLPDAQNVILENLQICLKIKNEKIDIFHSPSFIVPIYVSCKHIITIHDLIHLKLPEECGIGVKLYFKYFLKRAVNSSEYILTDSNYSKIDICEWAKLDVRKVKVTYLAAEKSISTNAKQESAETLRKFSIPKDFVFYNGNKKKHKNVTGLVEAFGLLKKSELISHKLVIAGKIDKNSRETDFTEIFDKVKALNIEKEVIFPGYISDVELADLYKSSAAFIFPSRYEGFGLPVLEAMAYGCPVICSNISSLPEICGEAAEYFDPMDTKDMSRAMLKVLTHEKLRNEMKMRGLEQAEKFSWKKCARETLRVYEEVYNETSNRS